MANDHFVGGEMANKASHDKSVLFICLGNTCRSPIAEAVFNHLINEQRLNDKWYVDSAALVPWHVGSRPDPRALSVLHAKNLQTLHIARQIQDVDFENFDFILGMDEENMAELKRQAPYGAKAKQLMLGSFDPLGEMIIDDPYCTNGEQAFQKILDHCWRSCDGFLKHAVSQKT